MRLIVVLLVLVLGGCSGGGGAATNEAPPSLHTTLLATASPSPSRPPTPVALGALPLGIVVKDFLTQGGPTYSLTLFGVDGRVAASATGVKRSHPQNVLIQMPSISASNSRLYYLDGDSKIMFLKPDGATGVATTVAVDSNSAAVFAVSPNDTRIAVAVLTFPFPAKTRIYVEDLNGGGHHIELFSSSTVLEWPVGWHEGHLVIGVGINAQPQNAYEGFTYADRGYHVVDAATGNRIATVCDGFRASGPPVQAGSVCVNYPTYEVSDWSGATRSIPADNGSGGGVLSPDGVFVAQCGTTGNAVTLVGRDGSTASIPISGAPTSCAVPVGWIAAKHLVVQYTDSSFAVANTDIDTGTVAAAPELRGFFAGAIPGGL
jgi:hypothetical protein